jgi:hypothetical protein
MAPLLHPWRTFKVCLGERDPALTRLMHTGQGVYMVGRVWRDRVDVRDLLYVGAAGGAGWAAGTFERRLRAHAAQLQRPDTLPECPKAWVQYAQQLPPGEDPLRTHAIRLLQMPATTAAEKAAVRQCRDMLLLCWQALCLPDTPWLPPLNSARLNTAALRALIEGPVEPPCGPLDPNNSDASAAGVTPEIEDGPGTAP